MPCNCRFIERLHEARVSYQQSRAVYMDYNATTPPDLETIRAFEDVARNSWANPASPHLAAENSETTITTATEKIKQAAGNTFERVEFCSNATEALHLVLNTPSFAKRPFLTSEIEHSAILDNRRGTHVLTVDDNGLISPSSIDGFKAPILVYSPVNHETGGMQHYKELYEKVKKCGGIVIFDAVQAAVRLNWKEWVNYCDGFIISGHKLYAPKGIGALVFKKEIELKGIRNGGSQCGDYRPLFPGTAPTGLIAALGKAVELRSLHQAEDDRYMKNLTGEGLEILHQGNFDFILESPENSVAGVLCISVPWLKSMEELFFRLNSRQIFLSRFSACTGTIEGASSILTAMGVQEERATRSLRISLGRKSMRDDFFRLRKVLEEEYSKQNNM